MLGFVNKGSFRGSPTVLAVSWNPLNPRGPTNAGLRQKRVVSWKPNAFGQCITFMLMRPRNLRGLEPRARRPLAESKSCGRMRARNLRGQRLADERGPVIYVVKVLRTDEGPVIYRGHRLVDGCGPVIYGVKVLRSDASP